MFVVVLVMQYFLPKPMQQPQQNTPQTAGTAPAANPPVANANKSATTTGSVKAAQKESAATAPKVEVKAAAAETETVVETPVYKITFTNKGAQVRSWILKQHKDYDGHPLDLVHKQAAALYGYPLSLFTYDAGLREKVNAALYVLDRKDPVPSFSSNAKGSALAESRITTLAFEFSDGATSVRKVFRFDDSYVI